MGKKKGKKGKKQPTEAELADDAKVAANQRRQDGGGLALPKLNLQFLTLADYLARNFTLFQLEAAYEIRQDLFNVLGRVGARQEGAGVRFQGWARMAVPVDRVVVTEVRPPKLGRSCPAAVTAEVDFHVGSFRPDIRQEWDALRQHDVLFLLTVAGPQAGGGPLGKVGLKHVRGCELVSMRDEEGKPMNDFSARGDRGKGPAAERPSEGGKGPGGDSEGGKRPTEGGKGPPQGQSSGAEDDSGVELESKQLRMSSARARIE